MQCKNRWAAIFWCVCRSYVVHVHSKTCKANRTNFLHFYASVKPARLCMLILAQFWTSECHVKQGSYVMEGFYENNCAHVKMDSRSGTEFSFSVVFSSGLHDAHKQFKDWVPFMKIAILLALMIAPSVYRVLSSAGINWEIEIAVAILYAFKKSNVNHDSSWKLQLELKYCT